MAIEQMYSIPEAAEITTLSEDTLWQHLRTGRLVRTKIGGRTVIRESELQKLIQDQEKGARPDRNISANLKPRRKRKNASVKTTRSAK
jgi:hypothetical protein